MPLIETTATTVPLLPVLNKKPVDLGCGRLSASVSAEGQILSLNGYHPQAGFITLAPIEQFPADQFYNTPFVRQYRRRLVEISEQGGQGFGLRLQHMPGEVQPPVLSLLEGAAPLVRYHLDTLEVSSLFLTENKAGYGHLINQVELYNTGDTTAIFSYEFGGTFSMNRCSYGQITEAGPIPIPPSENALKVRENHLSIVNRNLSARTDIFLFDNDTPLLLSPTQEIVAAEPVRYTSRGELRLEKGERRVLTMVYVLVPSTEEPQAVSFLEAEELARDGKAALPHWKPMDDKMEAFIVQRNIDYILSCCAVPIADEHVCVITDHQLLPLAWNRDVYYMIQLLFAAERQVERLIEAPWQATWRERVKSVIKGHLLWTFETAQRPHGYWGRAYLTTGYCKDDVFQVDQQCYPLLELCDYFTRFADETLVRRLSSRINEILHMLMEHKDDSKWLFKTGETPADDAVAHPYHFSSHVLIWWTLKQLASLNTIVPFTSQDLAAWSESVREESLVAFRTTLEGTLLFAYLTDLQGNYQLYHDANDLPTIYAPLWGFCSQDDEVWNNTLQFAFSSQNKGGFYPGHFGGLGSVHTPHPWPLGDTQELLYGQLHNDQLRYQQVLQKLKSVVQWDGLFSEAIDEESGRVAARHWFSWPGAFLSTVLLQKTDH